MEFSVSIRFKKNGNFSHSEDYEVEIPDKTKEDDEVDALMDAVRPILIEEFKNSKAWNNGNIDWELYDWDKI